MAQRKVPVLVEKRQISGRGLFVVPVSKDIRRLYLYLSVIRLPHTNFTSSKWNPDRSEYAKITYLRKDYILREDVMHFESTLHTWDQDVVGYAAYAQVCMYNSLIAYMDYIASGIGLPPLARDGLIYEEPLQDLPAEIKIVCRDDTAISAELWKYEYDVACPEADSESPPPPDPKQPDKVPVDYPIGDISPPYDGIDDGGDTIPYPSDESSPPDPGGEGGTCQLVNILYEFDTISEGTMEATVLVYAPYYSVRMVRTGTPGIDYSETTVFTVAPQDPVACASGEKTEFATTPASTVPRVTDIRIIGHTPA